VPDSGDAGRDTHPARMPVIIRDEVAVTVHTAVTFRKRGGRKMVVMPDGADYAASLHPQRASALRHLKSSAPMPVATVALSAILNPRFRSYVDERRGVTSPGPNAPSANR
jgi:hypothetical protein